MDGPIHRRRGAKLPHWTSDSATYSATFRLADSVPPKAAEKLRRELERLERETTRGGVLALPEQIRLARLRTDHIDQLLNAGHGECLFNNPELARIVVSALKHFDEERYKLVAWCVMPNHAHVVFTPVNGHQLSRILHSWKSFTANAVNRKLGRSGSLWQTESYDHLIRDHADLMHHVHYVRENPIKAGLKDWPWVG